MSVAGGEEPRQRQRSRIWQKVDLSIQSAWPVHTQAPKGLWFEQIPELNVLFEAMTILEVGATAVDGVELGGFLSVSELSSLPKSCAPWRATLLWALPMGHTDLEH